MTEPLPTKKYLLYARKSEESDERQVQSIDDQVAHMERLADERGLEIVETYIESYSAKEPQSRKVFAELLARIEAEPGFGILTWNIDRLSRNPIDSAHLQWLLQRGAIRAIQTPTRTYLPDDNALVLSVETSMANQYIRDLSRNVKRGLHTKAERGWRPGRAPIGYLNTKTQERGKNTILPDPERFHLVRKAFDLQLTGAYLPREILKIMNDEWGFRTPKCGRSGGVPLSLPGLYKVLSNPFYSGVFQYCGKWHQGAHKPMLTPDEFDRVQQLLGKKGKPTPKAHRYTFTGLFDCAECGHRISATTIMKKLASGERHPFVYYYCHHARRTKGAACSQTRYLNVEKLRERLVKELGPYGLDPQLVDWTRQVFESRDWEGGGQEARRRQALEKALEVAKREQGTLRHMRLKEMVDDTEYQEERERIEGEIAKIEKTLAEPELQIEYLDRTMRNALSLVAGMQDTLGARDEKSWRKLLAGICSNREIKNRKPLLSLKKWALRLADELRPLSEDLRLLEPGTEGSTELPSAPPPPLIPRLCGTVKAIRTELKTEELDLPPAPGHSSKESDSPPP